MIIINVVPFLLCQQIYHVSGFGMVHLLTFEKPVKIISEYRINRSRNPTPIICHDLWDCPRPNHPFHLNFRNLQRYFRNRLLDRSIIPRGQYIESKEESSRKKIILITHLFYHHWSLNVFRYLFWHNHTKLVFSELFFIYTCITYYQKNLYNKFFIIIN